MPYLGKIVERTHVIRNFALILVGVFVSAGAVFGAETESRDNSKKGKIPALVVRGSELIGRDVENHQEEIIAEIEDVLINEAGCIYKVVLSTGELFGFFGRRVAVEFDSLILKKDWKYRIRYKADGTKQRVPWRRIWTVVYPGDVEELRNMPEYHYEYDSPRGTTRGWGIYSYPVEEARE